MKDAGKCIIPKNKSLENVPKPRFSVSWPVCFGTWLQVLKAEWGQHLCILSWCVQVYIFWFGKVCFLHHNLMTGMRLLQQLPIVLFHFNSPQSGSKSKWRELREKEGIRLSQFGLYVLLKVVLLSLSWKNSHCVSVLTGQLILLQNGKSSRQQYELKWQEILEFDF